VTELSRRDFLRVAGAGAAGATLLGAAGCANPLRSRSDRTNVLVIVVDTLRADHVGSYGATRVQTPNVDRIVEQSLRFTRVYPEAMVTLPARRSLFTGRRIFPFRYFHPLPDLGRSPGWEPINDVASTLPALLRKAGYWTACTTDNPFYGFTDSFDGFRKTFDRFIPVEGYVGFRKSPATVSDRELYHWLPKPLRSERYVTGVRKFLANTGYARDDSQSAAARVFTWAGHLLDECLNKVDPFCLVVDCFEPHEPWCPPRKYIDMYGDPDYRGPEPAVPRYAPADYLSETLLERMQAVYAASVTQMDRWLGEFWEKFSDSDAADNTVVVFLSDHGILLGDRGWTGKVPRVLHPEMTHVPLAIKHPRGKRAGEASDWFASTHDVAPTLLSMVDVAPAPKMEGADLSQLFDGRPLPRREMAYGGYYNRHYVRTDKWFYQADNHYQERKLFDLELDPYEQHDLAAEKPEVTRELYERMLEQIGGRPPPYYSS
jgi:arylsulfatase A-like enzyme